MNAVQLLRTDGIPTSAFACGKCGNVFAASCRNPDNGRYDRDAAERCCTCSYCGKSAEPFEFAHKACQSKAMREAEVESLASAMKLETWDGWVYERDAGDNDGYFKSVTAFCEWLADHADEYTRPSYVFVCESEAFALDLESILQDELEDCHESVADSLRGCKELEAAVKAFNELNKGCVTYWPNQSRAVRVPLM